MADQLSEREQAEGPKKNTTADEMRERRPPDPVRADAIKRTLEEVMLDWPVEERQITEEMVERARTWDHDVHCPAEIKQGHSWSSLTPDRVRGLVEAALGAPSQETGELERLREALADAIRWIAEESEDPPSWKEKDERDVYEGSRGAVLNRLRSVLSPNQPEGEKATEFAE